MKLRTFLIFAISLTFSTFLAGQNTNQRIITGQKANAIAPGAEMVRMKSFSNVPNYIRFKVGSEISETKALSYTNSFVNIENADFKFLNSSKGKLGMSHKRYIQTIDNIPVEYSAWLIHIQNEKIVSMNGNIPSNPQINGNFTINANQALDYAKNYVNAEVYIFETESNPYLEIYNPPTPEKVYIPENGDLYSNQFKAAWKIDLFALKPYSRQYIYVDAETGNIIHTQTRIYSADVTATAQTSYSGEQTITTDSYNSTYRLHETGRGNGIATYNCQNTDDYDSAIDFTDNDNYWNNINDDLDQYATDAHFATEKTYDYYNIIHDRNSIDNDGLALNSYVHFSLIDYGYDNNINAFWNGSVMTYGDGSETITPLCTVDIAAHEITHGLTSYTCGLNYQNESGAINESFSDIFGTCVEHYAVPDSADWLIGEDIGTTFRSMSDPKAYSNPDTYLGEYWHTDASDHGGVHTNMSLLCYWFYLISEGGSGENDNGDSYNITESGIGIDSAANIAFRMQTVYLTNTSELIDARFFGIQSAIDFYGACSSEVETITNAFHAVGLGGEYVPNVQAEFSADYTENCTTPFTVNFDNYSINGSTFIWDFGDGTTSSDVNPSHTYTSMGNFDVSLYANGGTCGEDTLIITNFVSIDPSNPCMSFMPLDGDETINECYGTLFDSGGPDNIYSDNSDATFTIQPDGAGQIILHITEFDIEAGSETECDYDYLAFYDGANTSSTLINNTYYCNTNGNPQTISSTGGAITIQFHSDQGSSLNGFQINWECIQEDTPPTAEFSAISTNSCNGRIQFTNESINLPNTNLWNFGDGETSTEENPAHVYQSSGTYSVSLTVSNDNGNDQEIKTDYIQINLDPEPTSENQTVCIDSSFTISASSENGEINWFTDENCTNWIHSGSTWDHSPISEAITYYIRSIIEADLQNIGAENNTTNGGFFGNPDYIHYLIFDAYQEFTLISVSVNAENEGNRSIALRDQYGNTIDATEIYCPAGVSRIDLNLSVPIGQNLQLVGLGSPNLYRTNVSSELNYPYTIENFLSITGSSATSTPLSYYYYFYDWEIQSSPCESETSIMQIDVEDCSVGISDEFSNKITAYPNPADSKIYFKGLNETDFPLEINITDCNGRKIISRTINEASFDISQFIPGLYLIQINSNTINYQTKIVKK